MPDESRSLTVRTIADAELLIAGVRDAAGYLREWIFEQAVDPLDLLRQIKFDPVGFHPISHGPLNLIEQVNQTWTFLAALAAARQLLVLHPDAGGFSLAPGAEASQQLDIMSEKEGLVGAETFAAVSPRNNDKLNKDLEKLARRSEPHRYVFSCRRSTPAISGYRNSSATEFRCALSISSSSISKFESYHAA
jgi:hypothetical protein